MIRALTGLAAVVIASLTVGFAQQPNSDWANYGLDYYEQRFSPLDQINDRNAGQLGLAWQFETATDRGLEATPLVIDGVMYTTGSWSVTYAIDARTGKQMWKYDPEVHRKYDNLACCDVVNRGAAFYKDKVYVGVLDGRLVALDKNTGKVAWSTTTVDQSQAYTITDRGTMLAFAKRIQLPIMVEGDRPLLNIYSVMEVNPAYGPRVNAKGGKAFADFMLSPEVQQVIKTFGVDKYGQPLFVPIAGKKDEDL